MVNPLTAAWIPAADPLPLTGPGWGFTFLLLAAFTAHLMLVNVVVGSAVIAGVHGIGGRGTRDDRSRLIRLLAAPLVWAMALLVTFGVGTLLFVQVLYGPVFYTAAVILGRAWLLLPGLALAGYAALYATRRVRGDTTAPERPPRLLPWLGAGLAFLVVFGIQVSMHVVQVRPDLWPKLIRFAPAALTEPTWIWRYLHFAMGAIAFAGVFLSVVSVVAARNGRDPESCRWAARIGARWAVVAVGLQLILGSIFLMRLPRPALSAMFDPRLPHVIPLVAGIGTSLALFVALAQLRDPARQPTLLAWCALFSVVTQVLMVMTRHGVRTVYLAPYAAELRRTGTASPLGFVVFLAAAVAAFVFVGLLAAKAVRAARASATARSEATRG